jgi:hypothetical protein
MLMPPLPHQNLRQVADLPKFQAWIASDQGLRRRRLEDAWYVGTIPWRGGLADAAFLFDGLGGHPFGQEAAWAAAGAVSAVGPLASDGPELLRGLDAAVQSTGGGTTVVGLVAPHGEAPAFAVAAGDSSILAATPNGVELVFPHDGLPPHKVTDFLGLPLKGGHVGLWEERWGPRALLASDGFEELLSDEELGFILGMPAEAVPRALDDAMSKVMARGAPDNATVVLAALRP